MTFSKRNLSQTQINRRKKTGSELGRVSATTGLAGLGLLGASIATKGKEQPFKRIPGLRKINSEKLNRAALNTGLVGTGVGSVGGFTSASWQAAEAKQRKKAIVKSASPFEEGYYGEFGKAFDPEKRRMKRADIEQGAAYAGAGAAGTGAVHHARAANKEIKAANKLQRVPHERLARIAGHRGKAAGLGLLAGGAAYGAHKIGEKKKPGGSWQPYAKALTPAPTTAQPKKPGLNGGMKALRPMPKFKPMNQRPVSPNVKAMRPVQLGGVGGGGVGNTAGLSGVGKSSAFGISHD